MIICPKCSHENRPGYYYCENCGVALDKTIQDPKSTRKLDKSRDSLSAKATWGTARLTQKSEIILHITDQKDRVKLQIGQGEIVIGRKDSTTEDDPDIDLVPYGGIEKGVSRIHAVIERSDDTLTILDRGSSNGTFLNGQRLVTNQPRVLRDGDEIRFGKLVTRIYFR